MKGVFKLMIRKALGIDLGTSTIKIYKKGEGVILDERNIIAIANKKDIIAVGNDAFDMYEKTPGNINVTYPVKSGVIADIANMQSLLNQMLKRIGKGSKLSGMSYIIAVPTDITEVEKRAFYDLIANSNAKAKSILVVEKPVADALGAGLDVTNARGVMTVNIGADTTEISIMSLGGIVLSKLIPVGGNKLDESIRQYVKKKYNLIIGNKTAEVIKKELANAMEGDENKIKAYGRNIVRGLPSQMDISSAMVYESIKEYLYTIIDNIKIILERTPPEISSDIIDTGLYVTGGSANIKNLDTLIHKETDLTVNICKDASNSVVLGLGRIMDEAYLSTLATDIRQNAYSTKMRD